ncbi:MAG: GNAT family N-acetyltransferase [Bacteroidota bacterium]
MNKNIKIKKATIEDTEIIYSFICQLAEYEKLTDEVTTTSNLLKETLFDPKSNTGTLIAYVDERPVAFALYFFNYSTFKGKRGLYLEDLYVVPEMRGNGIGKKLLKQLAIIAVENDCTRFEWSVLDWNEPSIEFYKSLGAKPMDEWTVYRLNENEINNLANKNMGDDE